MSENCDSFYHGNFSNNGGGLLFFGRGGRGGGGQGRRRGGSGGFGEAGNEEDGRFDGDSWEEGREK